MKRRIMVLFSLVLVLAVGSAAVVHAVRSRTQTVEAQVVVNGRETGIQVQISSNDYAVYSELPLVAVLRELGAEIEWIHDQEAEVTLEDAAYVLNLTDTTFCEAENEYNLLIPAPGSRNFSCRVLEQEVMVDDITLKSVLMLMDISAYVHNRAEERQVDIEFKGCA